MSKEAMKLALEALKTLVNRFDFEQFTSVCELDDAKDAIKALEEALANKDADAEIIKYHEETIARLQEALAKQEQGEPVAWMLEGWGPDCGPYFEIYRDDEMGWRNKKEWTPLYTTPPQRTWVGLTDEEIDTWNIVGHESLREFVRAIEAKLKQKNHVAQKTNS